MSAARQPGSAALEAAPRRFLLFVAGDEPNSSLARANLERLRPTDAAVAWDVRVIDVLVDFQTAIDHGVLVTPTLILPDSDPPIVIVGNLRDLERVRTIIPGLDAAGREEAR